MKKLLASFMMLLVVLLTGCGTIEMELEKDGSGEVIYKLPKNNALYTIDELEEDIEDTLNMKNDDLEEDILKLKSVKEKDGTISIKISFKDFSALASTNSLLVPVEDMLRYDRSQLEDLEDLDGKVIDLENKKVKGYTYLTVSGIEADETIVKLPGKVKYMASGVELEDGKKDTIVTEGSSFSVVYEEGSSLGGFIMPAVIVIIIVLGGIFFIRRYKARKIEPTTIEGGTSQDA